MINVTKIETIAIENACLFDSAASTCALHITYLLCFITVLYC